MELVDMEHFMEDFKAKLDMEFIKSKYFMEFMESKELMVIKDIALVKATVSTLREGIDIP